MNILLTTLNAKYIHPNLAIRILYQLNKHHEGLHWQEFTIKEPTEAIANNCQKFDIVAFSCYIWNIEQTLLVAQHLKKLNPHIKILLGGPEVSYEWESIIVRDEIDYVIVGEGEIAFEKFLNHYPDVTKIPNLIWKTETEIKQNAIADTFDLQKLTNINPYDDDNVTTLTNKVLYIETSRGCPYKCEFCLASLDNKMRYLPTESIKNQLLYLIQHGRVIKFLDRTFNVKRDFTLDVFQYILDHHRPENVFQFEITADIVHPQIVSFIQEKVPEGLFRFEIGIQTVNREVNLAVNRKQDFEKTKGVIMSLSNKIEMHLDLIVGLPMDYWQDIKYSFEEVFKLFAPELQLGFLKFLKGTPVKDKHQQHGYVFESKAPYQIIKSNYLSAEELNQILKLEKALEIYWNKKRAIHTLKYVTTHYSIFDFLLQLGNYFESVSSFHQHSLKDIYQILFDFVLEQYPNDIVLQQLVGIDYYLHHKIKPQVFLLTEIDRKEKYRLLEKEQLNHHQYRYIALNIDFNFTAFKHNNRIVKQPNCLIVQYNGRDKAQIAASC